MTNNYKFIRADLAQISAYTPHSIEEIAHSLDHLDTNESPYDLPTTIKGKLAWVYQEEIETNRYPDGSHIVLKSAIAEYVKQSAKLNGEISHHNISVGNGSDELIRSILIATCLGGEGSILVANPTFSMYAILAKTLGIPVIEIQRSDTDFSLDLVAATEAIAQTNHPPVRVVFIVHPNSPTGNCLTTAELDWLRNLSQDILVVIDEAYFEFSQSSLVGELVRRSNWLILRTFSKAFRLAAHRVGYAIADPAIVAALEKVRLPYNLPSFSYIAALLALKHRDLLLDIIGDTLQEREKLWQILSQRSDLKIWQSQANFLYLQLNNASSAQNPEQLAKITQDLKNQGTLIRHTGGGLRITIGTPVENARTIERMQKILDRS
ncbi:MAG: histidinol-phosphate transaminase [Xenococcaceae cyanobacterium MO_188.B32]|nr:histidinol-phosphate transaminase [Xenococcaceae cyanobacterium MO_188.B32]